MVKINELINELCIVRDILNPIPYSDNEWAKRQIENLIDKYTKMKSSEKICSCPSDWKIGSTKIWCCNTCGLPEKKENGGWE